MSLYLLDSNVWVSLAIDRHEHHRHAVDWFDRGNLQFESHALRLSCWHRAQRNGLTGLFLNHF
jgi:hypothetical protein